MPTALSTTKRKFHKILDSISNASSTSLALTHDKFNAATTSLPATVEPPAKKPRVIRPTSAYVPPSARIMATQSPNIRAPAAIKSNSKTTMNEERKAPNFAPWDRGQFLERLKTYRHVDKWMGKPEKINEVEWAKRGWNCVGKERVGCVGGCGKEVVIALESSREEQKNGDERTSEEEADEDEWRERAEQELVEKYAEMIVTAHDKGCLWRRRGCDDTIHRLPLAHQATAIDNLRQRYRSLVAMASELPLDPSMPGNIEMSDLSEQFLPLLYPHPLIIPLEPTPATEPSSLEPSTDTNTPPLVNTSAIALAVFGWQAEEGHISGLATCTACFRRLGLWLFKPSTFSEDSVSPPSMDRLDVVGEHRDYCPWIDALSQNGIANRRTSLDGLAGWQVLMRAVNASAQHARAESGQRSVTSRGRDDAASEVGTLASSAIGGGDTASRDEKDKERWAKLKRLKQVFHVKRTKGKEGVQGKLVGATK